MAISEKKRTIRKMMKIIPNPSLWNKKPEYYKEYMSYVDNFNKHIDERDKASFIKGLPTPESDTYIDNG